MLNNSTASPFSHMKKGSEGFWKPAWEQTNSLQALHWPLPSLQPLLSRTETPSMPAPFTIYRDRTSWWMFQQLTTAIMLLRSIHRMPGVLPIAMPADRVFSGTEITTSIWVQLVAIRLASIS